MKKKNSAVWFAVWIVLAAATAISTNTEELAAIAAAF